jgi:tRNA pseudouridine13 synthase
MIAATLPLLTPDLAGCGGRIRVEQEDFEVEEIPAYEPCGNGEHLYLWIEKRGVGAEHFMKLLARKLGVPERDIGMAGLKDRHAVTRQWVSVPKIAEPRLTQIDGEGLKLLSVSRHANKLRSGHLRGNRFRILVRDADTMVNVEAILDLIRRDGLPNYYGPQRFGRDGDTATLGLRLLAGERVGRLPSFKLKLALSAAQSLLFNDVLARRFNDGLFRTVLDGDVMMKWPAGGLFVTEDAATEKVRFEAREIVTGGPMFGTRVFATKGIAAEREAQVLADYSLTAKSFEGFGQLASGTRRHNLVYLDDLDAAWEPAGLRLSFTLPSGSYATVLLREVMKTEAVEPEEK